eukprot:GHVQ01031709.1.p1 GENE.GHVQ01031709.1~~GHVQ01031709.1.p1  ORF type:complete len:676 (-),score=119.11 GHVQ01031709.1:123-1904(-)
MTHKTSSLLLTYLVGPWGCCNGVSSVVGKRRCRGFVSGGEGEVTGREETNIRSSKTIDRERQDNDGNTIAYSSVMEGIYSQPHLARRFVADRTYIAPPSTQYPPPKGLLHSLSPRYTFITHPHKTMNAHAHRHKHQHTHAPISSSSRSLRHVSPPSHLCEGSSSSSSLSWLVKKASLSNRGESVMSASATVAEDVQTLTAPPLQLIPLRLLEYNLSGAWHFYLPPELYRLRIFSLEQTEKGKLTKKTVMGQHNNKQTLKTKSGEEGRGERDSVSMFTRKEDTGRRERLFVYDEKKVLSPGTGCAGGWEVCNQDEGEKSGRRRGGGRGKGDSGESPEALTRATRTLQLTLERRLGHHHYIVLKGIGVLSPKPVYTQLDGAARFYGAVIVGGSWECAEFLPGEETAMVSQSLPSNVSVIGEDGQPVDSQVLARILERTNRPSQAGKDEGSDCVTTEALRLTCSEAEPFKCRYVGAFTAYRVLGEEYSISGIRNCFTDLGPQHMYNIIDPHDKDLPRNLASSLDTLRALTGKECISVDAATLSNMTKLVADIETAGPDFELIKSCQRRSDHEAAWNKKYADADFDDEFPPLEDIGF